MPLLGYVVSLPSEEDGNFGNSFVFKVQFKNHVYFFRTENKYWLNRCVFFILFLNILYRYNISTFSSYLTYMFVIFRWLKIIESYSGRTSLEMGHP